jgi:Cytochrome C oxidase, cbb3-type, subunit III
MANHWARRAGIVLGVLLGLLLLAAGGIYGVSAERVGRSLAVPGESFAIPADSATIVRGAHLASAIAKCTDCHGDGLGGQVMDLGPVGRFSAANLTAGRGGISGWSDADWIRALRHGVRPDSSLLLFMPSMVFTRLSESDLAAVIAWARARPPVDNLLPATRLGPVGRLLVVLKPTRLVPALGIHHAAPPPAAIPPGPTADYGGYLAVVGGCTYCHGDGLRGGIQEGPPGTPASADLTPAGPTAGWSEEDFVSALRTGVRPDGTTINPFMPWRLTRLMTDDEIRAVWRYLRAVK